MEFCLASFDRLSSFVLAATQYGNNFSSKILQASSRLWKKLFVLYRSVINVVANCHRTHNICVVIFSCSLEYHGQSLYSPFFRKCKN